jgi:hypothetical protein
MLRDSAAKLPLREDDVPYVRIEIVAGGTDQTQTTSIGDSRGEQRRELVSR